MWLATTGDSADLAVCHLIRCSNSAGLFFSPFCSKCVSVAAVFCLYCYFVLLCFALPKVLFLDVFSEVLIETRGA